MAEIRAALPEDSEQINRLISQLGYAECSDDVALDRLNTMLSSPTDFVWIYQDGRQVCGWIHLFVSLRLTSAKFVEIGGLVVDKSHRRLGVGRKLVTHAMQWSQANGHSVRVRCNAKREAANAFYKALGFELKKEQNVHELSL